MVQSCSPLGTADVKTNVDILESLTEAVGIESDAFKVWLESGAIAGMEPGAVDMSVLEQMREVIGIQSGGVVGIESGGVQSNVDVGGIVGIEKGGLVVDSGGSMIGVIAIVFGVIFFILSLIVLSLFSKSMNQVNNVSL